MLFNKSESPLLSMTFKMKAIYFLMEELKTENLIILKHLCGCLKFMSINVKTLIAINVIPLMRQPLMEFVLLVKQDSDLKIKPAFWIAETVFSIQESNVMIWIWSKQMVAVIFAQLKVHILVLDNQAHVSNKNKLFNKFR